MIEFFEKKCISDRKINNIWQRPDLKELFSIIDKNNRFDAKDRNLINVFYKELA